MEKLRTFDRLNIGTRIICVGNYCSEPEFKDQRGTIINIEKTASSCALFVEWDNKVSDFALHNGHNCGGKAKEGHGWNSMFDHCDIILESMAENFVPINNSTLDSMF